MKLIALSALLLLTACSKVPSCTDTGGHKWGPWQVVSNGRKPSDQYRSGLDNTLLQARQCGKCGFTEENF